MLVVADRFFERLLKTQLPTVCLNIHTPMQMQMYKRCIHYTAKKITYQNFKLVPNMNVIILLSLLQISARNRLPIFISIEAGAFGTFTLSDPPVVRYSL